MKDYYHLDAKSINYENILHLILRSLNFFMLSWLTIISAHYATRAQINFGIIASCGCISTPLNCLFSFIFWGERLTYKNIIGTIVVVCGVIWVSLSKGKLEEAFRNQQTYSEEERYTYKILSICCALFVGLLNSLRTL